MPQEPKSKLAPCIVHPLPEAQIFLGRETELERLRMFLGGRGVVSLVGVGGSGKTAIAERLLKELLSSGEFDALLVWSFYDDPDANAFLQKTAQYLTGDATIGSHGSGWFQVLKQAIEARPRTILILDGLERIQRPVTNATGIYGELEDPLLKAFLARVASSESGAKAIITSRFPLADLDRLDSGYEVINVNELSIPAASSLLTADGVIGSKEDIVRLLSHYGRHALTVDLLGSAVGRFLGGIASAAPTDPLEHGGDLQAQRLRQVLQLFERGMDPVERDLMSRMCVFRFGVNVDTLSEVFLKSNSTVGGSLVEASPEKLETLAENLTEMHLLYKEGSQYSVHPAVRDHFYSLFRQSAEVHGAITAHLLSLSDRPGVGLPDSKESLDLLEELVYHALRAGRLEEAREIYAYRLGGSDHINTNLGEYSRTYRILQAFPECPDPGGMYHCLRAFGAFDEALKWRPQNRYIRLALGHLVDLANDLSLQTRSTARFLIGEKVLPPEKTPDFPVTSAWLSILQGRLDEALSKCHQELKSSLFADDIARNRLSLIDVLIRLGRLQEASKELEDISGRMLSSGSQEHLAAYYHLTGRLEIAKTNPAAALVALGESLQLATEAGFDLFTVDILVSQAEALSVNSNIEEAAKSLQKALDLSGSPSMRYVWGQVAALSALAQLELKLGNSTDAAERMREALELQQRIGHQGVAQTLRNLSEIVT